MFSKPTERRSIAWQLILLFTVATSLLLACGLGLFYAIVVRHAFAEDNAVLDDKVAALRTDLHESGPNVFAEELKSRHAGEDGHADRAVHKADRAACRAVPGGLSHQPAAGRLRNPHVDDLAIVRDALHLLGCNRLLHLRVLRLGLRKWLVRL